MSDVQKKMGWSAGGLAVLVIASCFVQGCQQYGTVSPKAYEVATAMYSICNRQDESRLETVERLITESVDAGDITTGEQAWFDEMIAIARDGDWETAMMNARTMMNEQVER